MFACTRELGSSAVTAQLRAFEDACRGRGRRHSLPSSTNLGRACVGVPSASLARRSACGRRLRLVCFSGDKVLGGPQADRSSGVRYGRAESVHLRAPRGASGQLTLAKPSRERCTESFSYLESGADPRGGGRCAEVRAQCRAREGGTARCTLSANRRGDGREGRRWRAAAARIQSFAVRGRGAGLRGGGGGGAAPRRRLRRCRQCGRHAPARVRTVGTDEIRRVAAPRSGAMPRPSAQAGHHA